MSRLISHAPHFPRRILSPPTLRHEHPLGPSSSRSPGTPSLRHRPSPQGQTTAHTQPQLSSTRKRRQNLGVILEIYCLPPRQRISIARQPLPERMWVMSSTSLPSRPQLCSRTSSHPPLPLSRQLRTLRFKDPQLNNNCRRLLLRCETDP